MHEIKKGKGKNETNARKAFRELTIKDNFMFAAVMSDKENCRRLLEMVLGFPVKEVTVHYEYSMAYHFDYKGVRLDVLAIDKDDNHYDVEIQAVSRKIEKRSRYYHSQLDMKMLRRGEKYRFLPDAYVIFICDYDPVGKKKYRYTFDHICREVPEYVLSDGSHTIFLSTRGENEDEVPEELVRFLKYVAEERESGNDFKDEYVSRLQESVAKIKNDREMEGNYMLLEEMLSDEREAGIIIGKIESIFELLSELGSVPDDIEESIEAEEDVEKLSKIHKMAAKADSMEEFVKNYNEIV